MSEDLNGTFPPANVTVQGGVPGRDPTIPAVMFIFGVVGNLIAIVVLCKSRKEQKETTFYTLVFRLAIIELLGTCLDSPVTIATYVQNWWPGGDQLCEYSSFILLFFGLSGLSIICAMSIERYLAINHAYFYNHFVDKKLAGALTSMGLGKTTYLYPQTWCFIDWRTNVSTYAAYSYMYAGFSSFLILVTMLCNVMVCVALIRMQRQFMRWTSLGTDALISDFRRRSSFRRIAGAEIQMVILFFKFGGGRQLISFDRQRSEFLLADHQRRSVVCLVDLRLLSGVCAVVVSCVQWSARRRSPVPIQRTSGILRLMLNPL
uniref:G-protein coupled receptors family 1 profile domain-containing protein n=1 Tax=Leptobrachium leishanense TaxID=445787 RepID=A0A8C5MLT9_9ANUR